ncbi:response regulator transcription factor [Aquimarina sp. AU58]|uniref:response regulator n=1 Tax=Aquimarina sp. AU58 TaxID=1874112 RepID=UPI00351A2B37
MITVAIAEDHQSLIDGVEFLLRYEEEISSVGMANDGEELLNIVRRKQPKVVLTDIRMPKIDGIAATKIIKKEFPIPKLLPSLCLTRKMLFDK